MILNDGWVGSARVVLALWIVLMGAACSGDTEDDGFGESTDAGQTTGSGTGDGSDAGMNGTTGGTGGDGTTGAATCLELLRVDNTFTPMTMLRSTQIHAWTEFDGAGIWVAFNLPEAETNDFVIYAARMACDGTFLVEPFQVDTTPGGNKIDPAIALADDRLIIVWQRDSQDEPTHNLDVFYRILALDGSPIMAEDRILETTRAGVPNPGNAWMASAAALEPDGGFAIVGSWGHADAERFQVFVQRVDAEGNLVGDAIDASLKPDVSQLNPTVVAADGGELYVAWTEQDDDGNEMAAYSRLAPGAQAADAARLGRDGAAASPNLAIFSGVAEPLIAMSTLSAGGDLDVALRFASGGDASEVIVGESGQNEHTPNLIASGPEGGAMMWYRIVSGIRNAVFAGRVNVGDGGEITVSNTVMVEAEAPGIYAPAFTHVGDQVYLLMWSEGDSPDFMLKARFVDLK